MDTAVEVKFDLIEEPQPKRKKTKRTCWCGADARFGYESNRPIFCKEHRLVDAFDTQHPVCLEFNCVRRSSWGYPEDMIPRTCATHALDGYINVLTTFCVQCGSRFHRVNLNSRHTRKNVIYDNTRCCRCR